ncbi:MAG: extracellular solute-binding protein [Alphaproteobacteria bacterium]
MTHTVDSPASEHSGLSRRDILKYSLGLAAAGAASGALPRIGLAQGAQINGLMVGPLVAGPLRDILEKGAGAKVNEGNFLSSTDNIAKLLAPGGTSRHDIMMGVSEFSRAPILGPKSGDEKVKAYNMALVPNFKDLSPNVTDDVVNRDSKVWLIPIDWGYDSVLYNKDVVPENDPVTQSWGLQFSEKYAGRIAWFDVPHQMLMTAGLHLGHKAPETADAKDLDEFGRFLISKKKLVRTMYTSFAQAVNLMSSGEVVVMYGWIPHREALQKQGRNITNNWPSEGLLVWSHGAFIPKDAPNADAAMRLVNTMLTGEYGAALSRETGYLGATTTAEALLSADEKKKYGYDVRQRGIKTYGLKYPTDLNRWVEVWNKVKSA